MKTESKRKRSGIRRIVLIFFLVIYIPSLIHWVYGKTVNTEILRMGTIEDSINTEGCIIRNERVLKSPFEGKYIPEVEEGGKVPANFRIASILKKSSMELLEQKNDIDLKIIKQLNSHNEAQALFSEDVTKIDKEIGNRVQEMINLANNNEISDTVQIKNDLDELIKKKAAVLGGLNTKDVYINTLKKEKERIDRLIESSTKDVYTEKPGIVSYIIDGYEEVLNSSAIEELTPEFLNQIKTGVVGKGQEGNDTQIEKAFAKVIEGNVYYISVLLDEHHAEKFKQGEEISVRLNDIGKEAFGEIVHISGNFDGNYILTMEFDRYISETTAFRKINIDLIKSSYEGLKVPLKSLVDINTKEMKAKIVMVEANYAKYEDIVLKGISGEYAIISSENGNVSLYDTYIVNPGKIKEGQMVY
ncbi:MAG: HlyD family efflux transporter periplasmic adaptor subunit [Acetivibrionales bacterium]|jgi:hypothetical protein